MSESATRPLLYEVNTRCWLHDLSARLGVDVALTHVPEEELVNWQRLGFTHIWLMGVWTTGPRARASYLAHADTATRLSALSPNWREADVAGSPYAIAQYRVPESLGGERGLDLFHGRLARHGMKLLLDFVPNHVGLDHPWLTTRPELFVQSPVAAAPETFRQETRGGPIWIAHGKDPFFPAWNDTAQLDFRRAETRAAVIEELRAVAARCDGVRCDMAMLLLNDVFARTWEKFPARSPAPPGEFWSEALFAVKRPDFLFVAEAYWDVEARLQSLGFDFTYDKRPTDFLMERRPVELTAHLTSKGDEFVRRSVHFLENHDEPRVASRLSLAEHRAAALLMLGLPGICLLHEGQLTGARLRVPVHLARRPPEPVDDEISALYRGLLEMLPHTCIGRGRGRLLGSQSPEGGAELTRGLIVVCWTGAGVADLVVVNLVGEFVRSRVLLPEDLWAPVPHQIFDWLDDRKPRPLPENSRERGLLLEVPAHGAQLLRVERAR